MGVKLAKKREISKEIFRESINNVNLATIIGVSRGKFDANLSLLKKVFLFYSEKMKFTTIGPPF